MSAHAPLHQTRERYWIERDASGLLRLLYRTPDVVDLRTGSDVHTRSVAPSLANMEGIVEWMEDQERFEDAPAMRAALERYREENPSA